MHRWRFGTHHRFGPGAAEAAAIPPNRALPILTGLARHDPSIMWRTGSRISPRIFARGWCSTDWREVTAHPAPDCASLMWRCYRRIEVEAAHGIW